MGRPNTAMPCSPVLSAVAGGVLRLQFLQTFHLIALQPTELLAPAVVRHLADTNRTDRLGHALALRGQNINLAQLGDDLLRLVALSRHRGPPWSKNHSSGWTTSLGADHNHQPSPRVPHRGRTRHTRRARNRVTKVFDPRVVQGSHGRRRLPFCSQITLAGSNRSMVASAA